MQKKHLRHIIHYTNNERRVFGWANAVETTTYAAAATLILI